MGEKEPMPKTVGLCPDENCRAEYHMPDAKPGDRCPMEFCDNELVIFSPALGAVKADE